MLFVNVPILHFTMYEAACYGFCVDNIRWMNHSPGRYRRSCMAEMNRQMEAGNVQLAWFRTQEEYLARIDKLRLIDDDFFFRSVGRED